MAKSSKTAGYACTDCGWTSVTWVGRCGNCQAWGTVREQRGEGIARTTAKSATPGTLAPSIDTIDARDARFRSTGVPELDRVLGGGLVPGGVILLAGEPGVGKSTLLLDVAARVAKLNQKVLYVSGEESAGQIKMRAERIGAVTEGLHVSAETDLGRALGQIEALNPSLLIVDSVQTLGSTEVEGTPGGVTQVREVAASLIGAAKKRGLTAILVGHVTKDGSIAGPRLLEHLVDVVCHFEGDRHSRLRMLRAIKNRYGPTDELGCFDLVEDGIVSLADPSGLFLTRNGSSETPTIVAGTCVTITLEGARPLPVEVQALLVDSTAAQPRRAVSGLDAARVAMILAVMQKRSGLSVLGDESYLATVGGIKVGEPATDLAVAMALASAKTNRPVHPGVIAIGEIGLSGEIRAVPGIGQRVREAARLGFTKALVPQSATGIKEVPPSFKLERVATLAQALDVLKHSRAQQPSSPDWDAFSA